ncbi:response regulator [Paenibacillus sp. YIM B09110]|uniref:response regulator n=1 Tax=Paenibacillus sp. YIM B09110 TaxID=3126102 RepID=UPI00301CA3F9
MYKIVIVDDEMIVRHAVKTLILWESSRFEYAGSAANGMSALELINRTGADIVITDIKMPEMDGLELIKRLKADGFNGEVLVLSNYNDFELVREALKCGAYDYMLKLTLKTESFMQNLEEIAVKLDGRRVTSGIASERETANPVVNAKDQIPNKLRLMDSKTATSSSWSRNELFEQGSRVYSFVIMLDEAIEHGLPLADDLHNVLEKLVDGLFPGSDWTYIIPTEPRRFLLVIRYSLNGTTAVPEELARRLINLALMYYSVQISVIYGAVAANEETLALEMSLSRQAEDLLFYTQILQRCLSNKEVGSDGDKAFWLAESKLRDSFRTPNAAAIDLWAESALALIEIAAKQHIHPPILKRALNGGIWSVAHADLMSADGGKWEEKTWLEKVDAATSDSQLEEIVRSLFDEIVQRTGKLAPLLAKREEVRHAIRYLEQHYAERVVILDVAAHVGLSEPYLCHVFKTETGQSILTYLNEIRMNKAHEMLSSGQYLVKQAAIEVGIPDPFYFNRLFKRHYGYAPKHVKRS